MSQALPVIMKIDNLTRPEHELNAYALRKPNHLRQIKTICLLTHRNL